MYRKKICKRSEKFGKNQKTLEVISSLKTRNSQLANILKDSGRFRKCLETLERIRIDSNIIPERFEIGRFGKTHFIS